MVTSWPKNLPGPGVSAQRIADRIGLMSGGRLRVRLFAAGELVPALGVFDAVSAGTAQMAHTASFFWQGKIPASVYFTAIPFGLLPHEHITWIEQGGGQALWDELYAPFGLKPVMAGNTGVQMGGWYKRRITGLGDLTGLKIRMPGLGGEVMRRLGATPVSLPPGELFQALQSGVLDATEFLGPWSDRAMGFHKVASHYYSPAFMSRTGRARRFSTRLPWRDCRRICGPSSWRPAVQRTAGRWRRATGRMPVRCRCCRTRTGCRSSRIRRRFLLHCVRPRPRCWPSLPTRIRLRSASMTAIRPRGRGLRPGAM